MDAVIVSDCHAVCGQHDLLVIITDQRQWPHFPFKGFLCGHLKIGVNALLFHHKTHFDITDLANHHFIAAAKKFEVPMDTYSSKKRSPLSTLVQHNCLELILYAFISCSKNTSNTGIKEYLKQAEP